MTAWVRIQKFVGDALEVAMAAPPPTTRKAAFRIQKFVLVGDGHNHSWTVRQRDNPAYCFLLPPVPFLCNTNVLTGLMADNAYVGQVIPWRYADTAWYQHTHVEHMLLSTVVHLPNL
jgi:hypothetical protein